MRKKKMPINFMFNTENNIDSTKIRSASELSTIKFDKWNQLELLNFLDLYYKYYNENKNCDNVLDVNEYVVSGKYKKDRNE